MYKPSREEFLKKASEGGLVPVWRGLLADEDTPVSVYERIRNESRRQHGRSHSFLLESVEGGERIGRYSFLGGNPRWILKGSGRSVEIEHADGTREVRDDVDPLSVLKEYMEAYRAVPDPELPRFFGGAVGYIGYDAVAQFERVPLCEKAADIDWPDMIMAIADTIIIFDRVSQTLKIVANAFIEDSAEQAYDDAVRRIETLYETIGLAAPHRLIDVCPDPSDIACRSNVSQEDFEAAVRHAKEYIRAGDVFQTVLSQRFEVDYRGDPLDVYRALRSVNPSPYMFCLEFGDRAVVGSSPEIHVRCEDGRVEVRPVAGTRPRSDDETEDARLADELLADPKERAEHIMLVDLGRNDIGRTCTYGTVRVPELMVIERYSHVMHIVSDVLGTLAPDRDVYDLLRATFPAGTVSGAPKIRAMEIIAELEQSRRGPYAGAIGYFSFTGNLDSCITIRTVLLTGRTAYVQAGAGIVADSDPTKEYEETRNKASAVLKALALAERYAGGKVV